MAKARVDNFCMQADYTTCWSWDVRLPLSGRGHGHDRFFKILPQSYDSLPISTKIRIMKVLVWPVAMYGYESWTLRKNEETRLDAYEMKGLRKILQVSWTAKKTNEWVVNKSEVKRELLDTVKARKLAYYCHTMRK